MSTATITLVTLLLYKACLIAIGVWASRRTHDEDDFFLGGRSLGPFVAAISYSSSASSAFTLLGISGIAYVMGIGALWIVAGSVLGMLVAWFWIAPRLITLSRERGMVTLTDLLLADMSGPARNALRWLAALIILFSFGFYVAAQFQGAASTFASSFGLSMPASIVTGAAIIMVYTLLGGFWAVSVTDTVQGSLMAVTAVLLPVAALMEVGGWEGFSSSLREVSSATQLSWRAGNVGLAGAGFVIGLLCIGIGTFGQPHLLVRFMALRDPRAMRQARVLTIAWYLLVFLGMCFVGLVGHVLFPVIDNPETIFFTLTETLFPPVLGAVLIAAVLSAIMSTADSQLLVAASALAHDLGLGRGSRARNLLISRLSIVGLVAAAVLIALYLPEKIFSRVLFAWIALGSAFGPLVFARLAQMTLRPAAVIASVIIGFGLAVTFYLLPDTPGDIAERVLPFSAAALTLWLGRVPDRLPRRPEGP
jgi:sodium/proline symporter